jgi:hypothetical protein
MNTAFAMTTNARPMMIARTQVERCFASELDRPDALGSCVKMPSGLERGVQNALAERRGRNP